MGTSKKKKYNKTAFLACTSNVLHDQTHMHRQQPHSTWKRAGFSGKGHNKNSNSSHSRNPPSNNKKDSHRLQKQLYQCCLSNQALKFYNLKQSHYHWTREEYYVAEISCTSRSKIRTKNHTNKNICQTVLTFKHCRYFQIKKKKKEDYT